ncbi:hypothetical protein Anapl_01452 [Anas platyrhynchos]|uniref:Uncharacterized protein n=1 Tax=Anas platyrhynchos TaxID=8839 RepID=R0LS03_ANAPL|nr:hypothetical protein Anapl_01452 [Anas platyrhynchos]
MYPTSSHIFPLAFWGPEAMLSIACTKHLKEGMTAVVTGTEHKTWNNQTHRQQAVEMQHPQETLRLTQPTKTLPHCSAIYIFPMQQRRTFRNADLCSNSYQNRSRRTSSEAQAAPCAPLQY